VTAELKDIDRTNIGQERVTAKKKKRQTSSRPAARSWPRRPPGSPL